MRALAKLGSSALAQETAATHSRALRTSFVRATMISSPNHVFKNCAVCVRVSEHEHVAHKGHERPNITIRDPHFATLITFQHLLDRHTRPNPSFHLLAKERVLAGGHVMDVNKHTGHSCWDSMFFDDENFILGGWLSKPVRGSMGVRVGS